MELPESISVLATQDLRGNHCHTNGAVWFRRRDNFLDPELKVLEEFFPEPICIVDNVQYLTGAAQVSGKWILGYFFEGIFYPY